MEEEKWKKEAGEKMTEKCQKLRDQGKFQNEKKGANHFNCSFFLALCREWTFLLCLTLKAFKLKGVNFESVLVVLVVLVVVLVQPEQIRTTRTF